MYSWSLLIRLEANNKVTLTCAGIYLLGGPFLLQLDSLTLAVPLFPMPTNQKDVAKGRETNKRSTS